MHNISEKIVVGVILTFATVCAIYLFDDPTHHALPVMFASIAALPLFVAELIVGRRKPNVGRHVR